MATVEDDLIRLFETVDIKTGSNKPRTIKAWFDTDSADFLKWICSSITEENYLSNQEEYEYSQLEHVLTEEQLKKKLTSIESKHPGLFEYKDNLASTGTLKYLVKALDKRKEDCDHLLNINQRLNKAILNEFSEVSSSKLECQQELSSLQEKNAFLSQKLDTLYKEQIIKHDQNQFSTCVSYMQVTKFEQEFTEISNCIYHQIPVETTAAAAITDDIAELQKRIYQSKDRCLALEIEIETIKCVENYLGTCSFNSISSSVNHNNLLAKIDFQKQQQALMLKAMEEALLKFSEKYTNKLTLQYYQNELNSYQSRLSYVTKMNELFNRIISSFVIMHELCLQEKQDILNFRNFLKNVVRDVQDSLFRKSKMVKIIDEYKIFQAKDFENKFNLIGSLGRFLLKPDEPITKILDKKCSINHDIESLQKTHFGNVGCQCEIAQDRVRQAKALEKFLTSGPTCRVVTIPHNLQTVLLQVDQSIANQSTSLKFAMNAVRK